MTEKQYFPGMLVFDIDGVINDTHTTEVLDSILKQVNLLCQKGFKVYFNTGRSQKYCKEKLFPKLKNYPQILAQKTFAMCEKGVVKVDLENGKIVEKIQDQYSVVEYEKSLLNDLNLSAKSYFRDKSKVSMITFEKLNTASFELFESEIGLLQNQIQSRISELGLENTLAIDKTKIALDIQHVLAGKDLGAKQIILEVESYISPEIREQTRVYTFGVSPSDYAMAKHFAEQNFDTTHIDVGAKQLLDTNAKYNTVLLENTFENGTSGFLGMLLESLD
jgi:hydroxymethylpyrimidine pyrophosphatase-like HAD family hydrolase